MKNVHKRIKTKHAILSFYEDIDNGYGLSYGGVRR